VTREINRASLRAEIEWLADKDVVRAARLSEALSLLEAADDLKTKAAELLATASAAASPVGRASNEP
jgi:hypothetical protein